MPRRLARVGAAGSKETIRDQGLVPESEGFLASRDVHPLTDPRPKTYKPWTPLPLFLPTPHHRRALTWELTTAGPSTIAAPEHELSRKHKASCLHRPPGATLGSQMQTDQQTGALHTQTGTGRQRVTELARAGSLPAADLPCSDFSPCPGPLLPRDSNLCRTLSKSQVLTPHSSFPLSPSPVPTPP